MLPQRIKNSDAFEIIETKASDYELYGMICYWGTHYISYFKSDKWVCYDDNRVYPLNSWNELIYNNLKGHYYPTILFYKRFEKVKPNEPDLTTEEINKLIQFCNNYQEVPQMYKDEDCITRLRPNLNDKKLLNPIVNTLDNNFMNVSQNKSTKPKKKKEEEIELGPDEWKCKNKTCQNINKINSYLCLSKI
jgi:hypothetical protein